MTTADLLSRAQAAGLTLWREGDRLKYRGPTEAVTTLLPELRAHKAELLAVFGGGAKEASKLDTEDCEQWLPAPAALPDPAAEARRQRVLAMLAENLTAQYALLTHDTGDPETVILALSIRGQATCELAIPRDKYDGPLLLDLIDRHCGMVH